MKKALLIIVVLALSLTTGWQAIAEANLLSNSDFETGDTGQFGAVTIDNWTTYGASGWHHTDYNHSAGGSKAIKIWWDDTAAYQDVTVAEGVTYNFCGYAYTPAGGDELGSGWNGVYKVEWLSGDTKLSENEVGRFIGGTDAADSWKALSGEYTAPSGADTARVFLSLVNMDSTWSEPHTGSIGFDDLSAEAVPEPASIMLVASGLLGLFGITRKK
jgi:hypothetical protein